MGHLLDCIYEDKMVVVVFDRDARKFKLQCLNVTCLMELVLDNNLLSEK